MVLLKTEWLLAEFDLIEKRMQVRADQAEVLMKQIQADIVKLNELRKLVESEAWKTSEH